MSFWSNAGAEIWGAISSPISTVSTAAQNVWNSITWNFGYLSGASGPTSQVQQDINDQQQAANDWYASNPGATQQDYSNYLADKFGNDFSNYVNQGNTGSANNAVSNSDEYLKLGIFGLAIMFIILLFRR